MTALQILRSVGNVTDLAQGQLALHLDTGALAVRFAHMEENLPYADWETANGPLYIRDWTFQGSERRLDSVVWAEIDFGTFTITRMARENSRQRGDPIFRVPPLHSGYALDYDFSQGPWTFTHYHDGPAWGNVFKPGQHSPSRGSWWTAHEREIDVGETPDDVLMCRIAFSDYDATRPVCDIDGKAVFADLRGDTGEFSANGATFHLFVDEMGTIRRRWHLIKSDKLLTVGDGTFTANGHGLPNGAEFWTNSWSSNGVLTTNAPNLNSIYAAGISARGGVPTGRFDIRLFQVTRN